MNPVHTPNPWKTIFLATACWIFFIGLLMILSSSIQLPVPAFYVRLMYGVFGTISAIAAVWIVMKFETPEDRIRPPFIENGFAGKFAAGFLIGSFLMGLIILVIYLLTDVSFALNANFSLKNAWPAYLAILPLALMEEIVFRGWSFRKLNQRFDIRLTQLIVALGFALYHVLNGWGFAGSFAGPFVWSFIFGLAAWLTGGIAAPTGIHVALNILQLMLGFKKSDSSIWSISTEDDVAIINNLGLIMQLFMLVAGVYLTFYLHRKRSGKPDELVFNQGSAKSYDQKSHP